MRDFTGFIDVSSVDMKVLISKAFDLSQPLGMGILHHRPGPITEEELAFYLDQGNFAPPKTINLDYIRGRAVKLIIFQEGDKKYIRNTWFDHTDAVLVYLLKEVGIDFPSEVIARARAALP